MQITNVEVSRKQSNNRMIAKASVTFDNEFVVHDIKIIDKDKLFIAMPSKKLQNGKFKDIAHPINSETREKIQKAVLEKYNEVLENEEAEKSESENAENAETEEAEAEETESDETAE